MYYRKLRYKYSLKKREKDINQNDSRKCYPKVNDKHHKKDDHTKDREEVTNKSFIKIL